MEENWSPMFTAKVDRAWKIWVPRAVRDFLMLDKGDFVEVKVRLVKKGYAKRGELK